MAVDCAPSLAGFSLWSLFLQADWVVKSVILGLLVASVWSWSVVFSKILGLRYWHREADDVIDSFSESMMEKIETRLGESRPFFKMASLASQEWKRMRMLSSSEQRQMSFRRLEQMLSIHIEEQREEVSKQISTLASVGSTAPFVGLFGTVWGIMNSFQCIAMSKNTNLSVVAPGIAEALFATAVGLVVAIPAVIFYNYLTLQVRSYEVRLENFSQKLLIFCMRG